MRLARFLYDALDWYFADVFKYRTWRGGKWVAEEVKPTPELSGFAANQPLITWRRITGR